MDAFHPREIIMSDYVNTCKQVLVANLIVNVRVYPLPEERGKLINISSALVTKFQHLFLLGSLKNTQNEDFSIFESQTDKVPTLTHHLSLIIDDVVIDEHKDNAMLPKES